jgi:hypothetical protein
VVIVVRFFALSCESLQQFAIHYVPGSKTAADFLNEGKHFLATKEYDSAINAYSEAVALEPENYMNYFQVCKNLEVETRHPQLADVNSNRRLMMDKSSRNWL